MIEEHAFCPRSGAPLSRERHYDEHGNARRAPVEPSVGEPTLHGLTNGERRSSKRALQIHFRRCHGRHADPDRSLYRAAAAALHRLKSAASGTTEWDFYVWYALAEHLAREEYHVEWMHAHSEPRCPDCHGRLAYDRTPTGDLLARCGTDCTGSRTDALAAIRETVADLYARAFDPDEPVGADDLVIFG